MPADAAKLIGEQMMDLVEASSSKKGAGVLLALAIALFGARNGAGSLITALNIAYEERERRGLVRVNLLALAITACSVMVAAIGMIAIAALGHLEDLLPLTSIVVAVLGKIFSYLLFLLVGAASAATLYRFGPSRRKPQWVWLTPGSVLTASLWLLLTAGFGFYVAWFGHYDATYGSLGAVVVMLTWLYLSSYVLLFGPELNSELEKQTEVDTTSGPERPIGERGAWAADHVTGEADGPNSQANARDAFILPAMTGARTSARGVQLFGGAKVGLVASVAATAGLATIKRRGSPGWSITLLGAAVLMTWLGRDPKKMPGSHSGSAEKACQK
jgi:membrane protein